MHKSDVIWLTLLLVAAPANAIAQDERDFSAWLQGPAAVLLLADELDLLETIDSATDAERFREWFWARRDPDPETPSNEFLREFRERISYAAREFGTPGVDPPGWATPQGRIYLLLGPPDWSARSARPFYVEGEWHYLTLWHYDARLGSPPVRFAFVKLEGGVRIATEHPSGFSPAQAGLIDAGARALVDFDVAAPVARTIADRSAEALPVAGTADLTAQGVIARLDLPIRELMGTPGDDRIAYRYRVEWRPSGSGQIDELAGEIEFALSLDDLRNWSDQPLSIAIWFPTSGRASGVLRLTEIDTGRVASLPAYRTETVPDQVAVAHPVAVVPLASGQGAAIAFFAPCQRRHPEAVATLIRLGRGEIPTGSVLPGGHLALLELPR